MAPQTITDPPPKDRRGYSGFFFRKSCQQYIRPSGPSRLNFFSSLNMTVFHSEVQLIWSLTQWILSLIWWSVSEGTFLILLYRRCEASCSNCWTRRILIFRSIERWSLDALVIWFDARYNSLLLSLEDILPQDPRFFFDAYCFGSTRKLRITLGERPIFLAIARCDNPISLKVNIFPLSCSVRVLPRAIPQFCQMTENRFQEHGQLNSKSSRMWTDLSSTWPTRDSSCLKFEWPGWLISSLQYCIQSSPPRGGVKSISH